MKYTNVRSSVRRRRWISRATVLTAMVAGLLATVAASPASAAPPDRYTLCLPAFCQPPAAAVVTGTVTWDANVNQFRAQNNAFLGVVVTFAEIDGGVVVGTQTIRVLRGAVFPGGSALAPTTDALRITLCPHGAGGPLPTCSTVTVTR